MAAPLFFMVAGALVRAATPVIAKSLAKFATKATQKEIAKGGAKTVTDKNIGVFRTLARPGGKKPASPKADAKAAPKPKADTKATPKPKADAKAAPKPKTDAKPKTSRTQGRKKQSPTLKADPKAAPSAVKARASKKAADAAKDKKLSALGTKGQRRLLGAGLTAASIIPLVTGDSKDKAKAEETPDYSNSSQSPGGRKRGEGTYKKESSGGSFKDKFKEVYAGGQGRGKKFTFNGKEYVAVTQDDVKKAGAKSLKEYLEKKSGKAKGGYAQKNNMGTNDFRMGGTLMSVEDRRRMR